MAIALRDIYCTKQIADKVECYNRQYAHIGTFPVDLILPRLQTSYKIIDRWVDWTGGLSKIPGKTFWWSTCGG